jgi:hypothetical protein
MAIPPDEFFPTFAFSWILFYPVMIVEKNRGRVKK